MACDWAQTLTSTATPSTRIQSLDALRGIAVLTIIFANAAAFAHSYDAHLAASLHPSLKPLDALAESMTTFFVTGKWRSVLMLLFGMGMALQYDRHVRLGRWPRGQVRRYFWLLAIALAHYFLLWFGDILLLYAVAGLVLIPVLKMQDRSLRTMLWIFGSFCLIVGVLVTIGAVWIASQPESETAKIMGFNPTSWAKEIQAYQTGTYIDQVRFRAGSGLSSMIGTALFTFFELPMLIAGILMARAKLFADDSTARATRQKVMQIAFMVGIPLNLVCLIGAGSGVHFWGRVLVELVAGPITAIGICALALEIWSSSLGKLGAIFARAGRMALSCYLLQSLIGTAIFYSWGGALFDRTAAWAEMWIAAGIFLLVLALANAWSRRFSMGPVEWLWRSLSGELKGTT